MKKLYTGYNLSTASVDYTPRYEWKDEAGVPTLWILNIKTNVSFNKPRPYLGFNLVLAQKDGMAGEKRGRVVWSGTQFVDAPTFEPAQEPEGRCVRG